MDKSEYKESVFKKNTELELIQWQAAGLQV